MYVLAGTASICRASICGALSGRLDPELPSRLTLYIDNALPIANTRLREEKKRKREEEELKQEEEVERRKKRSAAVSEKEKAQKSNAAKEKEQAAAAAAEKAAAAIEQEGEVPEKEVRANACWQDTHLSSRFFARRGFMMIDK